MGIVLAVIIAVHFAFRIRVQPITNLSWELNMKQATIKLTWTPSVSPDVDEQLLYIKSTPGDELVDNPGAIELEDVLTPGVSEYEFSAIEGDVVHVELMANDGVNDSEVAVLDFTVPDLSAPAPPTNLAFEIISVVDIEPEPEPEPEPPVAELPPDPEG